MSPFDPIWTSLKAQIIKFNEKGAALGEQPGSVLLALIAGKSAGFLKRQ